VKFEPLKTGAFARFLEFRHFAGGGAGSFFEAARERVAGDLEDPGSNDLAVLGRESGHGGISQPGARPAGPAEGPALRPRAPVTTAICFPLTGPGNKATSSRCPETLALRRTTLVRPG
jgi:hypothetical protein